MKSSLKEKMEYIIVFFATLVVQLFSVLRHCDYILRSDDIGPLIYPAKLAGFDWSKVTCNIGNYYGYGYYWIFSPLFRCFKSINDIISVIVIINIVILSLTAVLIYHISVNYFHMEKKWYTLVLPVAVTHFIRNVYGISEMDGFRTDNEIPMFIGIWLFTWVLLIIQECEKNSKRIVYSIVLAIISSWTMTVHERALSLIFAFVIAVVIIGLCSRKLIVEPISYSIVLIIGYKLHKFAQNALLTHFYTNPNGKAVRNTSATKGIKLWFMDSWLAVKSYAIMIFGNLHEMALLTGGILVVALAILTVWVAKNRPWKKEKSREVDNRIIILGTFVLAVLIVAVGIGMNWGDNLYKGLQNGKEVYAYKGIGYLRYYYSFLSVITVSGAALIDTEIFKEKATKIAIVIYFVVIEVAFFTMDMPLISGKGGYLRRSAGYLFMRRRPNVCILINVVIVVVLIALFVFGKKIKSKPIVMAYITFAVVFTLVRSMDLGVMDLEVRDSKEITKLFDMFEEADINLENNVYLMVTSKRTAMVQLIKPDLEMNSVMYDCYVDGLLFTYKKVNALENKGYAYVRFGTMYAYTNREEYKKVFDAYQN